MKYVTTLLAFLVFTLSGAATAPKTGVSLIGKVPNTSSLVYRITDSTTNTVCIALITASTYYNKSNVALSCRRDY